MVSVLPVHRIADFAVRLRAFPATVVVPLIALLAGQASAGRVNFAKYQKVTASSQNGTYAPEYAVDGIVSNFHSFRTGATGPHSLDISYPRSVTLASAHLYLGLNNVFSSSQVLQNFKFQYHDGTAWTDVPGSSVTGNAQTEINLIFSQAVTSDRFRLSTTNTGNRIIREIALFPPNLVDGVEQGFSIGTDVRLSLGYQRPTVASTIRENEYPKRAVDGYVDDLSRWQCDGTAAGDTLDIDLLDTHIVGSAHLYSGAGITTMSNPAENFVLDYWDGAAWQPIPGAAFSTNTDPSLVIPFVSPVTTSKIRYRTTTGNYARVRELLLFPPRIGGYPLGQDVEIKAPPVAQWDDTSDSSWKLVNSGPDYLIGLVNGSVVFANNASDNAGLDWQLLLNHRDGSYRVRHVATGDCLALGHISLATNTPVVATAYTGMPHQDWLLDYIDATHFRLINVYSGLAINSVDSSWSVGTAMMVTTPGTGALQQWTRVYSTHHPKKGIAATHNTAADKLFPGSTLTWMENSWQNLNGPSNSWSYSWGRQTSGTLPFMTSNHTFNPMQWGNFNWIHGTPSGPVDLIRNDLNSNPKPAHVMGFNEPDKVEQANMTVDTAIALWPRLEALDAPLVAPAPANTFGTWLPDWAAKADARGYRRNYTPYHWYASPSSDQIITNLQNAYTTYGRPIWLTEFSAISWTGSGSWTKATNYNFLAEFMWRAEALPWLKRYSIFQFMEGRAGGTDNSTAPRANVWKADGSLTAFGELYAGWDGVTSVVQNKAYHLHNRGTYRRLQNPASTDTVASLDPETPTVGSKWFIIPGTTANTVHIVSTRDGRRLRFYTGTYVGLAASTNTQPQVEWRVVANQHGWHFIEHPNTNQRLRINSSGTLVMGSITGSSDDYKWRFAVPAAVDNVAPVLAAIPPLSVNEGVQSTFTASATDADLPANTLTYSLIDAPSGASIDANTGVFAWTPTEVQGPGSFNFTLRVSDAALIHDQAVSVTVNEINVAPVLAAIPPQTVKQGDLLTFTANSTDGDLPANTLAYSLLDAPSDASIDASTGVFCWTPTETQAPGTFNLTVRVSDGSLNHDQLLAIAVVSRLPSPEIDTDGDGLSDLLEFAFLTDTEIPNSNPFRVIRANVGTLTLEFPWNWRASGLTWQLRHGQDLSNPSAWPVVAPGTVTATREGDIDRITITPAMAYPYGGFYVLEVRGN